MLSFCLTSLVPLLECLSWTIFYTSGQTLFLAMQKEFIGFIRLKLNLLHLVIIFFNYCYFYFFLGWFIHIILNVTLEGISCVVVPFSWRSSLDSLNLQDYLCISDSDHVSQSYSLGLEWFSHTTFSRQYSQKMMFSSLSCVAGFHTNLPWM